MTFYVFWNDASKQKVEKSKKGIKFAECL